MSKIINLSTAGIHFKYAVETEAGVRPTTGYIDLEGVKSTPSLNPAPETLETTDLNQEEWKTYIDGLKDLGGALEFTFNLTENLMTIWDTLMDTYTTNKASGKSVWFFIDIPGLTKGFFFKGNPSPLGAPETAVNSVLETTVYITPTDAPIIATKPED